MTQRIRPTDAAVPRLHPREQEYTGWDRNLPGLGIRVRPTGGKSFVLPRVAGWQVSDKRIERLWEREGPKVQEEEPRRGRLWFNDGSCIGLPNVPDELTWESLEIWVQRMFSSSLSLGGFTTAP